MKIAIIGGGMTGMLLLAIGWGFITPLLVWLARALSVIKKTPP